MFNGLGLGLGLWSGRRLRVMNGAYAKGYRLRLDLRLWSGLRLRSMVNGLGLRLGACLIVWG